MSSPVRKKSKLTKLHVYFDNQVHLQPRTTAIVCIDQSSHLRKEFVEHLSESSCKSSGFDTEYAHEDVTYYELDSYAGAVAASLRDWSAAGEFIGIAVTRGVLLPIGILGFYSIDLNSNFGECQGVVNLLGLKVILADESFVKSNLPHSVYDRVIPLTVGRHRCYLIHLINSATSNYHDKVLNSEEDYAFAIRTSGTTGNSKVVLVPHISFISNLESLRNHFDLNKSDILLSVAPATFDPFIVDVFLAFSSGATLLLTSESTRFVPDCLAEVIQRFRPTFLQCTPSLLLRFRDVEKGFALSDTNLRILALGGEKCLKKTELMSLIAPQHHKIPSTLRVYNLYGITEVSCWASVQEVNFDCLECEEISLGQPLRDIRLKALLSKDGFLGEMLIGFNSSRSCTVLREQGGDILAPLSYGEELFIQTGDIVKRKSASCKCKCSYANYENYIYVQRTDRICKRNGVKVDLELVEQLAVEKCCGHTIVSAHCFQWKGQVILIIRPKTADADLESVITNIHLHLKKNLKFEYYPDKVIVVNGSLPLNNNGKLDVKKIVDQDWKNKIQKLELENAFKISDADCDSLFCELWKCYTRIESFGDRSKDSFISCGGNSATAVRFVEDFFLRTHRFGSPEHVASEKHLTLALLRCSYDDAARMFHEVAKQIQYRYEITEYKEEFRSDTSAAESNTSGLLKASQTLLANPSDIHRIKYPFVVDKSLDIPIGLCVDATPVFATISKALVLCIIGSHAGTLFCFDLKKLPWNGSPEVKVKTEQVHEIAFWTISLNGRIETAVVLDSKNCGYIGCHDGTLSKFDVLSGEVLWNSSVDSCIRSSPALATCGTKIVTCTPNRLYCVNTQSGLIDWIQDSEEYILQNVSPVTTDKFVIIATKAGLKCHSIDAGSLTWTYSTTSGICTSPEIFKCSKAGAADYVLAGSINGTIFAVNCNSGVQVWSFNPAPNVTPNPVNYLSVLLPDLVIYTNQIGEIVCLSGSEGTYLRSISIGKVCRSKLCAVSVCKGSFEIRCDQSSDLRKTDVFIVNSVDGNLLEVELKDDEDVSNLGLRKLCTFGNGSESFSSPALSTEFGVIAIGSRDNCIHFFKLKADKKPEF